MVLKNNYCSWEIFTGDRTDPVKILYEARGVYFMGNAGSFPIGITFSNNQERSNAANMHYWLSGACAFEGYPNCKRTQVSSYLWLTALGQSVKIT